MFRILLIAVSLITASCSSVSSSRPRVYAWNEEPQVTSPLDGAKVLWVIGWTDGKKTHRHLGISMSDGSYWRYEYHGIEPATADDRKDFDALMETWNRLGTKLEDFARD